MSRTGKTSPFSFSPSPFFCDTAEIQLCSSDGDGGHDGYKTKIKTLMFTLQNPSGVLQREGVTLIVEIE